MYEMVKEKFNNTKKNKRVMYKEVIFTLWNSLQATLASEKLIVLWNLGIYVSFYDELLSDFHL